jgi:AbiV family abortive infection protein
MKKYLQIVKTQKQGINFSKENSDNIYECATILAERNQFGTAISLLILSAEEITKSIALCLEIFLGDKSEVKKIIIDSKIKDKESYLYNHVDKHKLAKTILSDLYTISEKLEFLSWFPNKNIKKITNVVIFKDYQKKQVNSVINSLENYNDLKNKGFYVDNKKGEWLKPSMLSKTDYENCKKDIEMLRGLFSDRINLILLLDDSELCLLAEVLRSE